MDGASTVPAGRTRRDGQFKSRGEEEEEEEEEAIVAPPLPSKSKPRLKSAKVFSTLTCSSLELGPPLPPRIPLLKRSLSLTTKTPPPPLSKIPPSSSSSNGGSVPRNGSHVPLIIDPLRVRTPTDNLARSAPTLTNVNNGSHVVLFSSRGQIKFIPLTSGSREGTGNVVSLARWPLSDVQQRSEPLTIDNLAGKFASSTNEYVESPGTKSKLKSRIVNNKRPNVSNGNSLGSVHRLTTLSPYSHVTSVVISGEKNSRGLSQRLKRLMTGRAPKEGAGQLQSSSEDNSPTTPLAVQSGLSGLSAFSSKSVECSNSIICHKCGKCRCRDCLKKSSRRFANAPGKDALVDGLSCMCLVKPIFYHCLKDDSGEEDCSERPCACCSGPNCLPRWTILTLLLPCLPCLCFYLPLKYGVSSCYDRCRDNTSCSCSRPATSSSGCKILLDSEASSV